eukprot:3851584-Pleurochrysis_carterae.AAC.1
MQPAAFAWTRGRCVEGEAQATEVGPRAAVEDPLSALSLSAAATQESAGSRDGCYPPFSSHNTEKGTALDSHLALSVATGP